MQQDSNTPTYVEETTKVAEIKDFQGRTRFKVALTDFDGSDQYPEHDDLQEFDYGFQVTVVSYCYGEDPLVLVSRNFDDLKQAKDFFAQMRDQYAAVVTAETKDYEDIGVYARKTGYRVIRPDCCATCKWACPITSKNSLFGDWKRNRRGKYLCMNSALYNPDAEGRGDLKPVEIRPQVEAMGLCNGFERALNPAYKDPNHTAAAFAAHDMNSEMVIETIAKATAEKVVVGSLDTVIIPEVGKQIDEKLSNDPPIIEGNRSLDGAVLFDGGGAD